VILKNYPIRMFDFNKKFGISLQICIE